MVGTELPVYQCHKKVRAAKITGFRPADDGMIDLLLGEINAVASMPAEWHVKHKPQIGGYYVVYEDNYQSYSPAAAFESGYTLLTAVDAPEANEAKLTVIAREFIEANRVSCPEATAEDRVYENAPDLVEKLADVVGYYQYPED